MVKWEEKHNNLQKLLNLRNNPIGITFSANRPEEISAYESTYPTPTDDGRTGSVSAGCEFWIHSTEKTFYTTSADHANCSVGSVTHGFKNWTEVLENSDVKTVFECEWVTMDEVPGIKTRSNMSNYITYGPLKECKQDPDVVFIRINGEQLMRLKDAFPNLRIEGKPQCHIIPIAEEDAKIVASTGCALSRKRTGMSSNEMSATISGKYFDETFDKLSSVCQIDDMVSDYAKQDKERFL